MLPPACPAGELRPPNNGWPDTSVEVSASLVLGPAGQGAATHVECRPHDGGADVMRVPAAAGPAETRPATRSRP
eukprot:4514207-Prymnesium_polylepis.1